MSGTVHFDRDLEELVKELSTLAQLCNIRLRDPGVVDAVLQSNEGIRSANPIAFDKMRGLLVLAYTMVERSAAVEGREATAEIVSKAIADAVARRDQFN